MKKLEKIVKHWYVPLIIGILYLLFGLWCFLTPASTFMALSMLFSIGFLVSGILEIVFSVANRNLNSGWIWTLLSGIIDLVFGIYLLSHPVLQTITLGIFVAFWILFRAFMAIGTSIDLSYIKNSGWGWQLFFGILGVLAGMLLLFNPVLSGLYLAITVGLGLEIIGIYHIIFAFKIKNIKDFSKSFDATLNAIEKEIENE